MKDIKNWAEKIRKYLDASIEVFGYFSKHYSGHSPTDAKQFISFFSDDTHSKNSTLDRFFNNIQENKYNRESKLKKNVDLLSKFKVISEYFA